MMRNMHKSEIGQPWQLKPGTLQMIEGLEKSDWFSQVGMTITEHSVKKKYTWKEAIKYCKQRYSSNVQIESRNLLTEE